MDESSDVPDPAEELGPCGLDDAGQDRLLDLHKRLAGRVAAGRAIQFSATDLDLFVMTGALAAFNDSVAIVARHRSAARIAMLSRRSRPASGGTTHSPEDVALALAKARYLVGPREAARPKPTKRR